MMLLTLFVTGSVIAIAPITENSNSSIVTTDVSSDYKIAESLMDIAIPYIDAHYGSADGIIDPTEYSVEYTDSVTGITVHMEHNGTVLFVGLEAPTSGWIAFGWQNYTSGFNTEGLNGSDLIFGYAPGEPHADVPRVTGSEPVTVHYILKFQNGTIFQEGDVPGDDSTTPISDELLLPDYRDQIYGMRVGETRHFIIPAERGYNRVGELLYGEDLEYIITLNRIAGNYDNPTDSSEVVYSDQHGLSTYQHLPDSNQEQILAANASDDGTRTQLEYFIKMMSSDSDDISLINSTELRYPLTLLFGATEDITQLPVQHSDWSKPIMINFVPNVGPTVEVVSHEQDEVIEWVANFQVEASDNTYVRRVECKIDDEEEWQPLKYDFLSNLWKITLDASLYSEDNHVATFRAIDPSNTTGYTTLDFLIDRPYVPFLGMRVEVARTVNTELFQTTSVDDTFTVRNNGSAPIGAIELYLPLSYANNFLSIYGNDENGKSLKIVRLDDSEDVMRWRVYFFQSVGYDEDYQFTVVSNYHSLTSILEFDENLYSLKFLRFPVVPYVLTKASLTINTRSGDSLEGASPDTTETNIAPMTISVFSMTMTSYTPLIVGHRTTEIIMDSWGWLNYKETITLDNIGPSRENILLFTVPAYSTGIKIYDQVGVLAASQPGDYNWNQTLNLQINLRTDRFGVDGFMPDYSYTFFITYSIQTEKHQEAINTGNKLDIPLGTMGELRIVEHQIDVIIPDSLGIVDITDGYRRLYGVFDSTYRFTQYNGTKYNPLQISVIYQVSIAVLSRPLLFALIIGLVALAYVALRKVEVAAETLSPRIDDDYDAADSRPTGAPPEIVRKFATLYSRKTSLNIDLEKLEASRRRGKIKQREFMLRDRDIKSQIENIDTELVGVRGELLGYGSRYRDMIGQLELENEKIEGAKAGLRQLLRRKKKAQISRAAFEKIRQDYLKTIKKATTATDRILLTLQEEAGDI